MFFKLVLNSWGKFPNGIISGTVMNFGDYDQCIDIKEDINGHSMSGKYCFLKVIPKFPLKQSIIPYETIYKNSLIKTFVKNAPENIIWNGICIPSLCSQQQITSLFQNGKTYDFILE